MKLPKELTTVTTLSKTLAFIVFITLPIIGFFAGIQYQSISQYSDSILQNTIEENKDQQTTLNTNKTINVNEKNNNTTLTIHTGETLKVTLGNKGDGGYQFDKPKYNMHVIALTNHEHITPKQMIPGNFGSDIWTFKTIKPGETSLIVQIFRAWEKNQKINDFNLQLNVLP